MGWEQARCNAGKDQKVVVRLLATTTDKDYHCSPEVARCGVEQAREASGLALSGTPALTTTHDLTIV